MLLQSFRDVGVKVYRNAGKPEGVITLFAGVFMGFLSFWVTIRLGSRQDMMTLSQVQFLPVVRFSFRIGGRRMWSYFRG